MKAPKKIYIMPHTLANGFCRRWFEEPFKVECIEYVRKDAFIEKAVRFLKEWDAYRVCLEGHKDWFIEQFKKYMENE